MVTVTRSDDYRRSGEACLEMAHRARFPQDRAHWLTIAQGWFRLADSEDHRMPSDQANEESLSPDERDRVARRSQSR
jgi:hypothetical protein